MKFLDFITEMEEVEAEMASSSLPMDAINELLVSAFEGPIVTAEAGVRLLSQILSNYNVDVPAIYGMDPEGDEILIDLQPGVHLYIIYADNDAGLFDFYAEVVDDEGLKEILEDEEDDEE